MSAKTPPNSGMTVSVAFAAHTKQDLFSVVPGVSFDTALEEVSILLDIAKSVGEQAAMDAKGNNLMFASVQMVSMAKAVVDSISFDGQRDDDCSSREQAALLRLHRLFSEGVLIISPQAVKPAVNDARQLISWVAEQAGEVSA